MTPPARRAKLREWAAAISRRASAFMREVTAIQGGMDGCFTALTRLATPAKARSSERWTGLSARARATQDRVVCWCSLGGTLMGDAGGLGELLWSLDRCRGFDVMAEAFLRETTAQGAALDAGLADVGAAGLVAALQAGKVSVRAAIAAGSEDAAEAALDAIDAAVAEAHARGTAALVVVRAVIAALLRAGGAPLEEALRGPESQVAWALRYRTDGSTPSPGGG